MCKPICDGDCSVTANLGENVACTSSNNCATGLVCAGTAGAEVCKQWCTPINNVNINPGCPAGRPYCGALAIGVMYDGTSYGTRNGP